MVSAVSAYLACLVCLVAQSSPGAGDSLDKALEARGLFRSGVNIRLESEKDVLDAFKALQVSHKTMRDAALRYREVLATREQIEAQRERRDALQTRIADLRQVIENSPFRKKAQRYMSSAPAELSQAKRDLTNVSTELKRLMETQPTDRKLATLRADYEAENRKFHSEASAVESRVADILRDYDRLKADEEFKAARSEHERRAKVRTELGPSSELRKASEWLKSVRKEFPPVGDEPAARGRARGPARKRAG